MLSASIVVAEDFKTLNGKDYKNVEVNRVEPDGIVLKSKSGITKIYFTELPKEVQERFHYDAAKAYARTEATARSASTPAVTASPQNERRANERIATEQRENQEAIKNHHALIGMTAAEVRQAWGEPKRITRTVTERGEYEEWHYGSEEKGATLVFVNGIFKSGTRNDGK